ncbi:MAG TPA: hypothetical protein VF445_12485, partial [Bordetella sp.]
GGRELHPCGPFLPGIVAASPRWPSGGGEGIIAMMAAALPAGLAGAPACTMVLRMKRARG